MNLSEIYAEVRLRLHDLQEGTVDTPWEYSDEELEPHCVSAIRNLRVRGVPIRSSLESGNLSPLPSEQEGMLIAVLMVTRIITGDLQQKLQDGELGIYFKVGPDVIDTKTMTIHFREIATRIRQEFESLLTIALTDLDSGGSNVYGGPYPYDRGRRQ